MIAAAYERRSAATAANPGNDSREAPDEDTYLAWAGVRLGELAAYARRRQLEVR